MPSHDRYPLDRIQVLVLALNEATEKAGTTAWWRAGQYIPRLAEMGIDLHSSGALPRWTYPTGWNAPGWRGVAAKLVGVGGGALKRTAELRTVDRYDTLVILRDAFIFTGPPVFEKRFVRRANFTVFELDDAIFVPDDTGTPPLWTPEKAETAARIADRVVAGNEYLAEWARRFNDDVRVVPTAGGDWIKPLAGERAPGPPRLIWSGHPSGAYFIDMIAPALGKAAAACDFEMHVISQPETVDGIAWPPNVSPRLLQWESPMTEGRLNEFDVGLMPLVDSPFTRGKCAFKLIRYMAAGLPVICSPVGMNREVVVEGETGFFATSEDEWVDAIVTLVQDEELRAGMGAAGRTRYERHYSPSAILPAYADAITPPEGRGRPGATWSREAGAAWT